MLTHDSVTVSVDAVVYWRIQNAVLSVTGVQKVGNATRLLASSTLRNVLGTKNLSELLSQREDISDDMRVCSL